MRRRTICARVVCWGCDLGTLEPSSSRVDTKRSNPASLTSLVRRAGHDVLPSAEGVRESSADDHPVIVMSGVDIVRVLQREKGIRTPTQVKA